MKKAIFYTALMAALAIGSTTGINAAATGKDPTEVIAMAATPVRAYEVVTLSIAGPETVLYCQSHAQDIRIGSQSAEVVAIPDQAIAETIRDEFWTNWRWRSRTQFDTYSCLATQSHSRRNGPEQTQWWIHRLSGSK